MLSTKKLLPALLAGVFAVGFASVSNAATVSYDATLAPVPANMFGTSVVPDHFTLGTFTDATGDIVELGLRARYRVRPTQANDGTGLYGPFAAGTQTAAFGSPARADRAEWSYDFYINSAAPFSAYTFNLCIDGPNVALQCANPLNFDNLPDGTLSGESGNSLQLFFAGTPGNIGYDVNANGLYNISLSVTDVGASNPFGTVGITAQVPEPGTLALLGISLAGLAVIRRKKQAA